MMFPLKGGCPLPPLRHIWELNCGPQIHPNPPSPDLLLGLSEWETNRNAAGLGDSGFGEENMCQFSMIESCILHHLYIYIIILLLFQWSVIDALSARSRCLDTNWRSTQKLSPPQDTVDQADGRRDPKPAIKGSSSSGDQRTRNGAKNLNFAARVGKKIGGGKRYWLDLMNIVGIYASLQVCIRLQSITCIQETGTWTWCLSPFVQVKQLEMETWHKNSHFQVGKLQSKDWVKSEIGSCSTYMYSWESSGGVEGLCNHFSGLISQRHRSSGLMIVNSSTFHGGRQKHEGRTRTCPPTCSDSCMDR